MHELIRTRQTSWLTLYSDSLKTTSAIQKRPVSSVPTASSVYSQPSPELDHQMSPTSTQIPRSSSAYPEDVSPPDSPVSNEQTHAHSRKSSFNVSPISTDNPNPFASRSPPLKHSGSRYNSNLPVPKKNTKKFWKLPDKSATSPDQEAAPTTVRWDEYSGEPTSSDKGKPPSTTPGEVKLHEDPTPGRLHTHNFGTSTHISGGGIARKRVGTREISDASIQMRPEWKGAGGRHAIVPAPIDKPLPAGQSPKFPMGQQKKQQIEDDERTKRERQEGERLERERAEQKKEAESQEEQRQTAKQVENQRQEEQRAEQAKVDREREQEERKIRERVVQARRERDFAQQAQRAKDAKDAAAQRQREQEAAAQRAQKENDETAQRERDNTGQRNGLGLAFHPGIHDNHYIDEHSQPRTLFTASNGSSSDSLSTPMDRRSPLARNPSNEEMQQQDRRAQALPDLPQQNLPQQKSPKTPSARDQRPPWKPRTSSLPNDSPVEEDPSLIETRFRANLQNMTIPEEPKSRFSTTTYATTAYHESPPQTPEDASDSPAALSAAPTPSSILNRRRPIPPSGGPNAKPTRKPTPSETIAPTSQPSYVATSPTTPDAEKRSKVLPKAPAGQPKVDQVQTLQAKQDALRRRKHNIETVIHELTDVVQPSSIAYDKASRQEIKKTVEQLKRELAEVVKDEHETGLKLHRAWKRHEDFADFEPTSIWVRRVTH